jgi:cysteine desulfurase
VAGPVRMGSQTAVFVNFYTYVCDVVPMRAVYLDCNATTPIDPEVRETVMRFADEEYGNAGSRTHEFGSRAKQAVTEAREAIAAVVSAQRDEVVFTSGATEANNIAILGLESHAEKSQRRHIVTTAIEHKAVLEPIDHLRRRGFEVTIVAPNEGGWVDPAAVRGALRPDTLLVSVMHVNNETGIRQPLEEIASALGGSEAYFHVDAAQGFGKEIDALKNPRIDLISVSGHKVYAPKGIGALVTRRRGFSRVPLSPLMFGGGQERGLRPGTLPVPLIVGFGLAAKLAARDLVARRAATMAFRGRLMAALAPVGALQNGDADRCITTTLNVSLPGIDSEAVMVALKEVVAISNGSACTSSSYEPSHVLTAMGLSDDRVRGALRFSWCHLTPEPDWSELTRCLKNLI